VYMLKKNSLDSIKDTLFDRQLHPVSGGVESSVKRMTKIKYSKICFIN
jgi:hypothetical protein